MRNTTASSTFVRVLNLGMGVCARQASENDCTDQFGCESAEITRATVNAERPEALPLADAAVARAPGALCWALDCWPTPPAPTL